MNPYYTPPYMQQPQPIQQLPQQHMEQRVVSYFVDSAEQLSTINPMPNVIYLGLNTRDHNYPTHRNKRSYDADII